MINEERQFDYEHSDEILDTKTKIGYFFFSVVFVYALFWTIIAAEEKMPDGYGVLVQDEENTGVYGWILFAGAVLASAAMFYLFKVKMVDPPSEHEQRSDRLSR